MGSNASRDPFFDYIGFQQKRQHESPLTNAQPRQPDRKELYFPKTAEVGLVDGRREKRVCPKWYVTFTDATGRRIPGYTDKRATEAYANELQRGVDRENAGIIDRESVELSQDLSAKID